MKGSPRPRPIWLTAPLYVVTLAIVALDGWAIWFWARVDGSLGRGLALAGVAVALLLLALLVVDARRQWLLSVSSAPEPAE
jgi:polyferredoxin